MSGYLLLLLPIMILLERALLLFSSLMIWAERWDNPNPQWGHRKQKSLSD